MAFCKVWVAKLNDVKVAKCSVRKLVLAYPSISLSNKGDSVLVDDRALVKKHKQKVEECQRFRLTL